VGHYRRKRVALQGKDAALQQHHLRLGKKSLGIGKLISGVQGNNDAKKEFIKKKKVRKSVATCCDFPFLSFSASKQCLPCSLLKDALSDSLLNFSDRVLELLGDSLTLQGIHGEGMRRRRHDHKRDYRDRAVEVLETVIQSYFFFFFSLHR
jgi:hypothetical protein